MAPNLRALCKQERFCLDTMRNLLDFMQNYNERRDKDQLPVWRERLEEIFEKFQSNRLQMDLLEEEAQYHDASSLQGIDEAEGEVDLGPKVDASRKARDEFELNYVRVKSFLIAAESKANPPQANAIAVPSASSRATDPAVSRIKLPEVKLPSFDGSLTEWLTFRDTFRSLIDSNPQLLDIDKFSYLVASLSKEAKRVVESIEITSANYSVAWNLLKQRFDNKKLVVKTYLDSLFSIEPMKRECYDSLVRLIDDFERNLQMIAKMGIDTEGWSILLAHMVCSRLDSSTLKQWENHNNSTEAPKYRDIMEFLRRHSTILQSIAPSKARSSDPPRLEPIRPQKTRFSSIHSVTGTTPRSCPFCKQAIHSPFKCEAFRNSSVQQRYELVKRKSLCINCLSPDHQIKNCASSACRVCGQKHHTMLHQQTSNRNPTQAHALKPSTQTPSTDQTQSQTQNARSTPIVSNQSSSQTNPTDGQVPSSSSFSHCSTSLTANVRRIPSAVLLQTAIVKVFDPAGHSLWARVLLDPASQINVIAERLAQRLMSRLVKNHHVIGGIGKATIVSTHSVFARIQSHCSDFSADLKFHVLREITHELPSTTINTSEWNWPSDVVLADPKFHEPASIDMIIGVEVYYELLLDGLIRLGPGKPVLQNTALGWVVSGRVGVVQSNQTAPSIVHVCSTEALEDQLSRFWELESCQSSSIMSVEETTCEAHFAATTSRDEFGRFVVVLPKKPSVIPLLGNSYEIAKRRFLSLERRLQAEPNLKTAYSTFIHEYRLLNHMQEVPESLQTKSHPTYYLPHHCVVRPESVTTKLRVVFDASCATDTGISLNDALMVGPVVQDDLISITLRFRMSRYAIISDVEKMYRQIWLHQSDHSLQRILWRNEPFEPIRTYELTTVTYGTSAAPYLATKCLQELAKLGQSSHPAAAQVVANDFYMDDMISGVNSVEEGKILCTQLLQLFQSVGFSLRKWSTNSPDILAHIPAELRDERTVFDLDLSSSVKTLGLKWEPASDRFRFQVPKWSESTTITKRIALSDSARLYDPLGLVGPVIVLAKLFMQELWRNQRTWDEPLEEEVQQRWLQFRANLTSLEHLTVPRWVVPCIEPTIVEVHGFCDASERAYGACIYLRTVCANGNISVLLLTSKSKVAPLGDSKKQKKICLPRLELSSALLLSHLYQKVQQSLKLQLKSFFWTDSMIALYWLSANPSRWKTFVANRVSEIQHLTKDGIWAHVPGIENPADIISRGMLPAQLMETTAWWEGPPWLQQPERFRPPLVRSTHEDFPTEYLEEKLAVMSVQVKAPCFIFSLRSSYNALVRLVSYLLRFTHNCKPAHRSDRKVGFLSTNEITEAVNVLVKISQKECFAEEIRAITVDGQVKPNSRLKTLTPILKNQILRVGGRLENAPIADDRKHPMILHPNHPFTELIADHYHKKLLHAGPQLIIANMREKFWPLRVRNLARRVVHSCIKCFRCKPTILEQLMGELPPERVTPTFPFLTTGVDLCGPFYYRHAGRKSSPTKGFVAIFVCLVTKAVHIELVADLSTNAFVSALKRFVARRGLPAVIECDNAKNFVGASRELAELAKQFASQQHQHVVTSHCSENGIWFKFIPPRSPNFGGIWEAAVKSCKKHLKATLGTAILMKDDLETLLTQTEGCLNSRPLTQLSSDPEDLEVLTPGHFLVSRPLVAIPEPSYEAIPKGRLDRYQLTQEYLRRIWKHWSMDYLSGLLPRTKWTRQRDNVTIGTMVLLKEDNLPPLKWRLGRITQIFRGDDGNVRVVSVKTKDGELRRAISNICVLPVRKPATAGDEDSLSDS
ncbi:uncharacterized protein LOC131682920 [Topomyia yanbarensis]|uniref:uncharacterized protein LOC131682920 n=1 Tax=Topomyia yanbarensis TaxID=2498891 RepID=UPI00273BD9DB|nr:uncharacterized protein LOC131682920 [Topomyia yanbarensis]